MVCKSPGHIGLFGVEKVKDIIEQWRYFANRAVSSLGVIPEEVFHEVLVEGNDVIQQIGMPVSELLLDSAVKPLHMGI